MKYLYVFALLFLLSCGSETTEPQPKMSPADYFYQQRTYPTGQLNQKSLQAAAIAYAEQLQMKNDGPAWLPIGPYNIGGRVTALALRQRADGTETIYLGAASGGIFRSDDNTQSWTPIFDEQPSLAIGTIALSPHNETTIYVGTGEINGGGGSIAYEGTGVYRSTDDGVNWTHLGLPNSASIGRITIDPTNPDRIFVAAMGTLYSPSEDRGIYRTLDGGENWERVLYQGENAGGLTVLMDPTNPQKLYATLWERLRRPFNRQYHGPNSGVYISEDGGDTWTESALTAGQDFSKISLAMAPSDPDVIYAAIVNTNQALAGIYHSSDGGANWTPMSLNGLQDLVSYEYWFNEIFVDPLDADVLHRLGFRVSKYRPSQEGWNGNFTGTHVDNHALWIDPQNPNRMMLGNDGGLYLTENGGTNYSFVDNLPITQAYAIEVDPDDASQRFLGTQDNGSWGVSSEDPAAYEKLLGGDGFRLAKEPGDQEFLYLEFQYGSMYRNFNGSNSLLPKPAGDYNWNTPIVLAPDDPRRIYTGAQQVVRSNNRGFNWEIISPSLVGNDPQEGNLPFNSIYTIGVSSASPTTIWAGLDNGHLWVTEDDGQAWRDVSADLPNRWVSSVLPHPVLPQTAYVTFSGFRWDEATAHVYRTDDAGENWINLEANLPDVPVNEIVIDEATLDLYLATDIGVYRSTDDGLSWSVFGTDLPALVVTDLRLHAASRQLFAGTYGRSMYMAELGLPTSVQEVQNELSFAIFPNPAKEQAQLTFDLEEGGVLTVSLLDLKGRRVGAERNYDLTAGAQQLALNLDGMLPGFYLVKLQKKGQQAKLKKLVLQ